MRNFVLFIVLTLSLIHGSNSTETRCRRYKFSTEEDQKLIKLVQKHGQSDWIFISEFMPNRNSRQCRDRWNNYLNPNLNKAEWTNEEISMLMMHHESLGNQWTLISTFFPGRSKNEVRNKAIQIINKFFTPTQIFEKRRQEYFRKQQTNVTLEAIEILDKKQINNEETIKIIQNQKNENNVEKNTSLFSELFSSLMNSRSNSYEDICNYPIF